MDAAYAAMIRAIEQDQTPSLFALQYDPEAWRVSGLLLIPRFAFSRSAIERRRPLAATARRAGWVGCNILLSEIPPEAKIEVISLGIKMSEKVVRQRFQRLRSLAELSIEKRAWTLDVLNAVRSLEKAEFSLRDVYALDEHLARLHPTNRHIHEKARQQLQVLRNLGFIEFLDRGHYRLR